MLNINITTVFLRQKCIRFTDAILYGISHLPFFIFLPMSYVCLILKNATQNFSTIKG